MTDEEAAERARELHGDGLLQRGAHGVSVEQVKVKGKKQFAVVAMVADPTQVAFPDELSISTPAGQRAVPLVVRKQQPFKLD
jgi:hypothetical protein